MFLTDKIGVCDGAGGKDVVVRSMVLGMLSQVVIRWYAEDNSGSQNQFFLTLVIFRTRDDVTYVASGSQRLCRSSFTGVLGQEPGVLLFLVQFCLHCYSCRDFCTFFWIQFLWLRFCVAKSLSFRCRSIT